jgi:hypothetical protein
MKTSETLSTVLLIALLVVSSACAATAVESPSATQLEPTAADPVVVTLAVGGVT